MNEIDPTAAVRPTIAKSRPATSLARAESVQNAAAGQPAGRSAEGVTRGGTDRVELSELGVMLSRLREMPGTERQRPEMIEATRKTIAADAADSPERLDAALDGLIDDALAELLVDQARAARPQA